MRQLRYFRHIKRQFIDEGNKESETSKRESELHANRYSFSPLSEKARRLIHYLRIRWVVGKGAYHLFSYVCKSWVSQHYYETHHVCFNQRQTTASIYLLHYLFFFISGCKQNWLIVLTFESPFISSAWPAVGSLASRHACCLAPGKVVATQQGEVVRNCLAQSLLAPVLIIVLMVRGLRT